ncbi:hypothetical protein CAR_c08580 [Carnobacterium sp. 17-4]|uniref:hypothetical protein n=1 Tax=Carnobacterium sp. (strain 17-4) TaxID=208596 RepID=UPI0002058BF3|nr:hypothetical protein [Carnobacterium sp. 17-4]AEB29552.1 hypothetical protein CAR_c08580 [Carnobacterium sp. 17-4]
MDEKHESDFLNRLLKAKNKRQRIFLKKTANVVFNSVLGMAIKEKESLQPNQFTPSKRTTKTTRLNEKELLQQTKNEAEEILAETFHQSEKMYQEVQQDIAAAKEEIKLKKKQSIEQYDKEKVEADKITRKAELHAKKILASAHFKSEQLEEEISLKKAVYHQEIDRELEKLVKEKEWFEQYQEQVQESMDRKEKVLFYETRKKIEQEHLEKAALQNKVDYLKALNAKRKINSYRIGLMIFGCTVVMSVLLAGLRYSTPLFTFIITCLAFVIACLAFVVVYINLVDGKNEKKIKGIGFQNASLIEKNKELIDTIEDLEKDIKQLIDEKIQLERTKRQSQDNIEFLKIMQADLKQSEINRRILESENAALRKHLISEEAIE